MIKIINALTLIESVWWKETTVITAGSSYQVCVQTMWLTSQFYVMKTTQQFQGTDLLKVMQKNYNTLQF